jgi:cytochrome P450/NADPH-cytochrome P450 reductase
MAVALILQRFQVELAEPDYELKIRQTLTIKPIGYHLKVRMRPGKSLYTGIVSSDVGAKTAAVTTKQSGDEASGKDLIQLAVFYGSNQGTCKTFAETIRSSAPGHGVHVTINTLDSGTENLPSDKPVVIITPSYEGQPPDNGRKFVACELPWKYIPLNV